MTAQTDSGAAPGVSLLGEAPVFIENTASNAANLPTDNDDVYGTIFPR